MTDELVFMGLTGAWALSLFGFISVAMLPIPFILFKWGPSLRARSKHSNTMMKPEATMVQTAHQTMPQADV
jgi:hypothetical protein